MPETTDDLVTRRATPADRPGILSLAEAALGWTPGAPHDELFAWKHDDNPFGPTPMWVAEADGRIVGLRALMRWRFRRPDGRPALAVRAVDTATHPDAQGKGIFRRLTLGALDELGDEGVDFVFNTPNDQSRPGYLKMGWQVVGRAPIAIRLRSVVSAGRTASARQPAGKWPLPCEVGVAPSEAFADGDAVDALLASRLVPALLHTERSSAFLRWRYGLDALGYRVVLAGNDVRDGLVVFRLRRRGPATEATVCDLLFPASVRPGTPAKLVRHLLSASKADYAICASPEWLAPGRFLRAPRLGPVLTWRSICDHHRPALDEWNLALGDLELF